VSSRWSECGGATGFGHRYRVVVGWFCCRRFRVFAAASLTFFVGHYARMTLETFWQLIDDVRHASSRLVEVPQRLTDSLCRMDEQEIVDFESHYIDCLHWSYDARLWLAAVVMMHGCGDDTFSDFRGWLIAQGRARFESALADP